MRSTIGITVLGLALGAADARAQHAGELVRLTSVEHHLSKHIGTVIRSSADTLAVQVRVARQVDSRWIGVLDTLVMARRTVDTLEVRRRGKTHARRGALIGWGSGMVIGGIIGYATYKECKPTQESWGFNCLWEPESAGQQAMMGAGLLSLVGAGVGALVGSVSGSERWEAVPRGGAAVSVRPLPAGGLGVGLAVRF